MKIVLQILLLSIIVNTFGQEDVKFEVETLSKPGKLLRKQSITDIYKELILKDVAISPYQLKQDNIDFPFNLVTHSETPDSLVHFGYHSFFNGMYQAYSDHRPFVLSPDMIWLLISQGFARHVNANPKLLRNKFVDFKGKLSLTVFSDNLKLDSPPKAWEGVFSEFTQQIGSYTGNKLMNLLASDFSTTTPAEKVASEITIMEAMKPYFEFIIFYVVCGIPEITMKGSPDDWQKIIDKTKKLGDYNLRWWTDELEPILEEFLKTSKGDIDREFWRNMFKYHSVKKYGAPKIIDGWIVKFFPYDKNGKRNNLKQLNGGNNLPDEIVKVDLKYMEKSVSGDSAKAIPLELWAGFVGLDQNPADFALTPRIGWMIRKKDVEKIGIKQKLKVDNDSRSGGIAIRVKEIPKEIYEIGDIKCLEIDFIDKIIVPDKLKDIKIEKLVLSGKIDQQEIERISKMFPNTKLIINWKSINSASNKPVVPGLTR